MSIKYIMNRLYRFVANFNGMMLKYLVQINSYILYIIEID